MRAAITGMNGTVAPYIGRALKKRDIEVVVFDRTQTGLDYTSVSDFIRKTDPDYFFHIATGPVEWVRAIAEASAEQKVPLIFTSSVSVFSESGSGPYTIDSFPDAEDDYGLYKIACEKIIHTENEDALIIRLGWQIGKERGTNNMFDFLSRSEEEKGFIEASSGWYPSCSFLEDTAEAIVDAAAGGLKGTYLLNANRSLTFYEIVQMLREKENMNWDIRETDSPRRDDRMFDDRLKVNELTAAQHK